MTTRNLSQRELEILEFKRKEYEKIGKNLDKILEAKDLQERIERLKQKYYAYVESKDRRDRKAFKLCGIALAKKIGRILGYKDYMDIPFFEIPECLYKLDNHYRFDPTLSLEKLYQEIKAAYEKIKDWELNDPRLLMPRWQERFLAQKL